jgi:hypothetical protein
MRLVNVARPHRNLTPCGRAAGTAGPTGSAPQRHARTRSGGHAALILLALALAALGAIAAPASAAPVWDLEMHHNQTNFSSSVPGSISVRTITQGSASESEVQEIAVKAESGNFTLGFEGDETELAAPATNPQVQLALRLLPSINGAVSTSLSESGATSTYTVTFRGALANTDVPQIVAAQGTPPLAIGAHPQYWIEVNNVGPSASSGTTELTVELPAGMSLTEAPVGPHAYSFDAHTLVRSLSWGCTGTSTVHCETDGSIPRHTPVNLALEVAVGPPLAEGEVATATATLKGGGAAGVVADSEPTPIGSAPAPFGVVASAFEPDFLAADAATPERRAGGHPDLLVVPVDFNSTIAPTATSEKPLKRASGALRDLSVDLPPGFLGAPTAVGECSLAQYTVGACPPSSPVGRFDGTLTSPIAGLVYSFATGVFNMVHPRGAVTDLAFQVGSNPVHVKAALDPANRYAITTTLADVNESTPPFSGKVTIWGVPADGSHDSERCPFFSSVGNPGHTSEECSTDHPKQPFVTMPAQCAADNVFRLHSYDSWQDTGVFGPDVTYSPAGKMTDCDAPRFEPEISLRPTGTEAGTPTGLDVSVHVPQNDNPNAQATPPVKSTTVTLPEGMAVNPGFSDGLAGCSESEIGLGTNRAVRCPDNSRIGEVELDTPLLPRPVEGSMYLAKQGANPFGSLLAFYLALHDTEERGVLVKVAGKVSLDPETGQITTSFDDLPQFPFEDLTLKFRSGDRAPLVNPPTCGTHRIAATMSSYAQPSEKLDVSDSFSLDEGPGGAPCHSSLSSRPFDPQLTAGTLNPVAGAFSPLSLRVTRTDADQELLAAHGAAPAGLSASVAGIPKCSEAQIAAAIGRNSPGEGADEIARPSCPAASQVGRVVTGAGAGPSPIYVSGKVYLAGPYKGAPLSGVAIVPAVAGPVDLGVVVVRAPAYINPVTAQVSIRTDALPQVVNGVLVRVRDVRIHLDRPGFTLNPTSCEPKALTGTLFSAEGKTKALFNRFQVGSCGALGFQPRLGLKLKGGVRRGAHPAFKAVVTPRPGEANFSRAVVTLPRSAFLEQAHIRTICTRVQFAAGPGHGALCPQGSQYGYARAWSPLLDAPAQGPVYLRSSNHKLPDLVVALHGPPGAPIDVELASRIDSFKGGIRSTFEAIPDIPVSRFILSMQGGKKGLIVNSRHLCHKPKRNRARANLKGQNGKRSLTKPRAVAVKCAKRRKAKRARARRSAGHVSRASRAR